MHQTVQGSWELISYRGRLMSLELSDSSHIIIRSSCLVNFVSEVKEKRSVMKVFIKYESFCKNRLYVSLVIFVHCDI